MRPVQTTSMCRSPTALAAAIALPLLAIVPGCAGQVPTPEQRAADDNTSRIAQVIRIADATRAGGDMAAAAALYQRAYAMAPERPEPLIALAETASLLGRHEEAAQAYRKAIALAPDNPSARRGYGKVLIALNRPNEAVDQFRVAVRLQPNDHTGYNGLGVAFDVVADHKQAQQSYLDGIAKAPNSLSLRNNLALSLALDGNQQKAISLLQESAGDIAADPRIRQNLALVYALAGQPDKAAAVARADLTEQQVQNNLAFYQSLQGLSGRDLAAVVLGIRRDGQQAHYETTAAGAPPFAATQDPGKASRTEDQALSANGNQASAVNGESLQATLVPSSGISQPEEAPAAETMVITRRTNFRAGPNIGSEVLAVLTPGQRVEKSEASPVKGYYRVAYNNKEGWVWWKNIEANLDRIARDGLSSTQPNGAHPFALKPMNDRALGTAQTEQGQSSSADASVVDRTVTVAGALPAPSASPSGGARQALSVSPPSNVFERADARASKTLRPEAALILGNAVENPLLAGVARDPVTSVSDGSDRPYTPQDVRNGPAPQVQPSIASVMAPSGSAAKSAVPPQALGSTARAQQPDESTTQQMVASGRGQTLDAESKDSSKTVFSSIGKFFGFGYNSVAHPRELAAYCERNRETWIYDNGTRSFVFCRDYQPRISDGYLMATR